MTNMEKQIGNRKPVIGLLPSVDDMTGATKLSTGYMNAVIAHGGIPFLFTFLKEERDMRQLALQCDAFLFTGGIDPDPVLYGEEKLNDTVEISECCDALEFPLIKIALELDKPILGICRGIQVLNVALGGTLYQDLAGTDAGEPCLPQAEGRIPRSRTFYKYRRGHAAARSIRGVSNVCQYIPPSGNKTLAPDLLLMASTDDGIAEAACVKEKPYVFGVQWHPELIYDKNEGCDRIFSYFIDCAKQKMVRELLNFGSAASRKSLRMK